MFKFHINGFLIKRRKTKLKKTSCNVLCIALFVLTSFAVFAKENLAILPFTGGQGDEGETIAELFSFNDRLNDVFSFVCRGAEA